MAKYDLSDFLEAQISAAKYEHAHPDLATYHTSRARALRSSFRIEPEALPDLLDMVFADAMRAIVRTHGAFDGMMECPRTLVPFVQRHGPSISAAVNAIRVAHLALMRDVLGSVHDCRDTVVTSEDLRRLGFDDDAAPDSVDYF
jgi:hypothetical protein